MSEPIFPLDSKMASFSIHCQAGLHDLCPGETDVMYCICDHHEKDGNINGLVSE